MSPTLSAQFASGLLLLSRESSDTIGRGCELPCLLIECDWSDYLWLLQHHHLKDRNVPIWLPLSLIILTDVEDPGPRERSGHYISGLESVFDWRVKHVSVNIK